MVLNCSAEIESYGLQISSTKSVRGICAISSLEYINDKYGFHTLDRTLRLCIGAWEGEQNSLSSNMLRGIAKLVYVYEDKLRDDLFKEKVGKVSPKELSRTAKERRAGSLGYAEAMLIAYNHRMRNPLRMSSLYKTKPKNRAQVEEYIEPEEAFGDEQLPDMDYNQETIAKALTASGVPSPSGKPKWSPSTVESILSNEKYKGDALLQKTFTVDFLSKKKKINEGEHPQYYVEHSHEAIIDPREWKLVQLEMERRKSLGMRYSGNCVLATRIVCGDCGSYFGPKVWNSTSKYKRTIWQCNNKFKGETKCSTPHIEEQEIKSRFVLVINSLLPDKQALLEDCRLMQEALTDCTKIDEQLDALVQELEVIAGLTRKCIAENATEVIDQAEYAKR